MNQSIIKNIVFVLLILFFCTVSKGQENTSLKITKEKKIALDKYLDYLEEKDQIIGVVSIARERKEVYGRSFGQRNLADKSIDAAKLVYQIGLSKVRRMERSK